MSHALEDLILDREDELEEGSVEKPALSTALVPLDGSPMAEAALPYARVLVPAGGQIVVLRVLPEIEPLLGELAWTLDSAPEDFAGPNVDAARAALDAAIARLNDPDHRWETQVALGDPAEQILRAIEQRRIDIVTMTTHGRGAVGRTLFGSVADRVSSASPVPVLLVRPHAPEQQPPIADLRRLVVPLDGSELAEAALPVAIGLARRYAIAVHLVRAIDYTAVLAPLSANGLMVSAPPEIHNEMVETIRSETRKYLASVVIHLENQGVTASWTVPEGSPFVAITEITKSGDLIVMTSHGRGGALRWLLGSVAEKLVREAPVPILLVPSAGRGAPSGASEAS